MTTLPDEDLQLVEAESEILTELRLKLENEPIDSLELANYAKSIGVTPPEGFESCEIVVVFPEDGPEDGVMAWLGPDTSGQGHYQ